jgi:signal transduction histidine kinase
MSIMKKIIDIHKGIIKIKSEENSGTTIIISFKE